MCDHFMMPVQASWKPSYTYRLQILSPF